MKLKDEKVLAEFRGSFCEWCRLHVNRTEAAHIFSKGAGRVDIRGNLVSLCRFCHQSHHDGNGPYRAELLLLAARREKTTAEAIVAEVYRIRRLDRHGNEPRRPT